MTATIATDGCGTTAARRFLFVSTCAETWGGSEELWWAAALALRSAGHAVHVAKLNVDRAHPRVEALLAAGATVQDLLRAGPPRAWDAVNVVVPGRLRMDDRRRLAAPLLAGVARRRPEVAVVCQGEAYDGVYLARCLQRLGLPTGLVSQKASELHWINDAGLRHAREVFAAAAFVVFVSRANRDLVECQLGRGLPDALVLDNPVLVPRARVLPWPATAGGELRLACVGRLYTLDKGQDLLLRALARPQWRDRRVTVDLIGQGINREGLEGMARHLGLEHVRCVGQVEDIAAVWRDHHALILPSRAEGQPLALLEAMACGRVPIVTRAADGGVVEDNVSGFVAAGATVDAIDEVLQRAWRRRAGWPAIGEAAAAAIARSVPAETAALSGALLALAAATPRRSPWHAS